VSVILKRPWTTQPQVVPQIDWSDPLTRGLVVCALPVGAVFYELVTGQLSGAPGTVKTDRAGDFSQSSRRIVNPGTSSKLANPTKADSIVGAWTVFAEFSPEVNAQGSQPIFVSTEPGNGDGFATFVDDANTQFNSIQMSNRYLINTAPQGATSGQILLANSELYMHRAMWSWDGVTNAKFYAKGVADTTVSGITTAPVSNTARRSYFLTDVAGVVGQAGAALICVWNRELLLTEYRALYQNPWQLFAPLPRRIWAPAAGAPPPPSGFAGARVHRMPHIGSRNG
jgi:hypothetical protein